MLMRITYSYQGEERIFERETSQVVIGRHNEGIDLTPDLKVSRLHARVLVEDGKFWVEDLNSKHGTRVNDEEIKGQGKRRLHPDDVIKIGDTTLRAHIPVERVQGTSLRTLVGSAQSLANSQEILDAAEFSFSASKDAAELEQRLSFFYELPLQLGAETRLESLLQLVIERVVKLIPSAKRGALLVKDRATGRLTLKAHLPLGSPAVSRTMAKEAMEQRKAFIISPQAQAEEKLADSLVNHRIESAMYAPLLWKDEAVGVLCVDNSDAETPFQNDDLQLLQAVAHHAAMAVAHHYTREELRRHAEFANRFFSSRFSPSVRHKLMNEASSGTLAIGTRRSEVTILISDIRGFTQLTSRLGAQRMSDLLNECFPPLIEAIFEHGGTIERFVGDAIFAVFGSPEQDENQHEHAVRAALEMQAAMKALNESREAREAESCVLGIGIDCGEALHGFIGNAERMEYAVIGEVANRASRYASGAREGEILISPEMHQWVWNLVAAEQTTIETKHEGAFTAYRIQSKDEA
ncbi:MAG: FHA domain-containing protein [Acidobacteria bacterium]|nr:FHA domain-containing protein [Acidobacteriota bacterium]